MAFKMKGSPMKRNFGLGSSPAKQISPLKGLGSEAHNEKFGPEHTNHNWSENRYMQEASGNIQPGTGEKWEGGMPEDVYNRPHTPTDEEIAISEARQEKFESPFPMESPMKSPLEHKATKPVEFKSGQEAGSAAAHNKTYGTPKHHDSPDRVDKETGRRGAMKGDPHIIDKSTSTASVSATPMKSPLEQTRFTDKLRSAAEAIKNKALAKEYGHGEYQGETLSEAVGDEYARLKKERRREDEMEGKKYNKWAELGQKLAAGPWSAFFQKETSESPLQQNIGGTSLEDTGSDIMKIFGRSLLGIPGFLANLKKSKHDEAVERRKEVRAKQGKSIGDKIKEALLSKEKGGPMYEGVSEGASGFQMKSPAKQKKRYTKKGADVENI